MLVPFATRIATAHPSGTTAAAASIATDMSGGKQRGAFRQPARAGVYRHLPPEWHEPDSEERAGEDPRECAIAAASRRLRQRRGTRPRMPR